MTSHAADATARRRPRVAVIVCSRDRPEQLAGALEAVCSDLGPNDELVVVDSASRDPAAVELVARAAGATLVRNRVAGLSRARNAGVAASSAPLVAFTDDDCRPRAGWLDALAGVFDDPQVGAVAGRVEAEDAGGSEVTTMRASARRRVDGWCDPIDLVHGANMAFRREALTGAHGFDELLGAGATFRSAEDHDMVFRVVADGWAACYEPDAVVAHRQWRRRSEVLRLEFGYGVGSGAFAVKTARRDHAAGGRLFTRRLWHHGIARVGRELLAGHQMGAAASLLKVAGVVVGAARGCWRPLEGPRYRSVPSVA